MRTSIVLLRGVNVGGHRLSMAELRADLGAAGYTNVRTYIQSGNVVLNHDCSADSTFAQSLRERISKLAGYDVPLALRSPAEMRSVVDRNPFDVADPTKLVVWFLDEQIPAAALEPLEGRDFGGERYKASGRELYLSLLNGQGRALLPVALGKLKIPALKTATARNWRTVEQLLELASAAL